MAGYVVQFLL